MRHAIWLFFILYAASLHAAVSFDKVVIWGHKLHSHTHSYVHNAFYRAFIHMGYKTYWFDDSDSVENFDFSHTLFITENQVDKRIPIRQDCLYILHNCHMTKYEQLKNRYIQLLVYRKDWVHGEEVEPFIFCDYENRTIYMPWATDLLPHEIDAIKLQVPHFQKSRKIYWVGTLGGGGLGANLQQIQPFINACSARRVQFIHKDPWVKGVSVEENIRLIQKSYMAPTLLGRWQLDHEYIPCRIFKNISYGKFGVTNSAAVNRLFKNKLIYHPDSFQLFFLARKRLQTMKVEELYELMDFVRDNHTYVNRIQTLLRFMERS